MPACRIAFRSPPWGSLPHVTSHSLSVSTHPYFFSFRSGYKHIRWLVCLYAKPPRAGGRISSNNFSCCEAPGLLPEKEWDPVLKILPDPQLGAFLRRGIRDGFPLGVSPSATLVSSKSNSPSALALASNVDEYIKEEVKAGNLAPSPHEGVHLSPIGFIPKKNRPG